MVIEILSNSLILTRPVRYISDDSESEEEDRIYDEAMDDDDTSDYSEPETFYERTTGKTLNWG